MITHIKGYLHYRWNSNVNSLTWILNHPLEHDLIVVELELSITITIEIKMQMNQWKVIK